jgi:hypothetical protein
MENQRVDSFIKPEEVVRQVARQARIAELNRAAGRNWKKLEDAFSSLEMEGIIVARYVFECACCASGTVSELSLAAPVLLRLGQYMPAFTTRHFSGCVEN